MVIETAFGSEDRGFKPRQGIKAETRADFWTIIGSGGKTKLASKLFFLSLLSWSLFSRRK
jgi:hypothetical protein